MKIVLLGYMASGKSLIGKKLAQILGYNFIDSDTFIESKHSKTISEIFSDKGEIYFRKEEHSILKELLALDKNVVLSLGGGTPCYSNNMKMLLDDKDVITIYLNVSIKNLVDRLENEKSKRPMISHLEDKNDLLEFIGKHLFERSNYYRQASLTIDANPDSETIIENMLLQLF